MNFNNILADFVTRLSIASKMKKEYVRVPYVKINLKLLRLLMHQGCIRTFYIDYDKKSETLFINVALKYFSSLPVVRKIEQISTPGKRVYWTADALAVNFHRNNFQGFFILSTPNGICTSNEILLSRVLTKRISGEILIKITF